MSRHLRLAACALTGLTALALVGCSSNSKPTAGHPANAAPAVSNPSVGTTAKGGGGSSSNPDRCDALKVADAQPLVKSKLSAAVEGNLGCAFLLPGQGTNGDNVTVSVYQADTSKKYYTDLTTTDAQGAALTQVSGVGDTAVWFQVIAGAPPVLVAHGGTTTCEVALPADTSDLTIEGASAGLPAISAAAAAAYVQKMGPLCTDVFAVSS